MNDTYYTEAQITLNEVAEGVSPHLLYAYQCAADLEARIDRINAEIEYLMDEIDRAVAEGHLN